MVVDSGWRPSSSSSPFASWSSTPPNSSHRFRSLSTTIALPARSPGASPSALIFSHRAVSELVYQASERKILTLEIVPSPSFLNNSDKGNGIGILIRWSTAINRSDLSHTGGGGGYSLHTHRLFAGQGWLSTYLWIVDHAQSRHRLRPLLDSILHTSTKYSHRLQCWPLIAGWAWAASYRLMVQMSPTSASTGQRTTGHWSTLSGLQDACVCVCVFVVNKEYKIEESNVTRNTYTSTNRNKDNDIFFSNLSLASLYIHNTLVLEIFR